MKLILKIVFFISLILSFANAMNNYRPNPYANDDYGGENNDDNYNDNNLQIPMQRPRPRRNIVLKKQDHSRYLDQNVDLRPYRKNSFSRNDDIVLKNYRNYQRERGGETSMFPLRPNDPRVNQLKPRQRFNLINREFH